MIGAFSLIQSSIVQFATAIQHPVQLILNAPVLSDRMIDLGRLRWEAGDVVASFPFRFSRNTVHLRTPDDSRSSFEYRACCSKNANSDFLTNCSPALSGAKWIFAHFPLHPAWRLTATTADHPSPENLLQYRLMQPDLLLAGGKW